MTESEDLATYLRESVFRHIGQYRDIKPTDKGLRRLIKRAVPPRARDRLRLVLTDVMTPLERKRARIILANSPVQLQLGSGAEPKQGWTNVDLAGGSVDLAWNLTRRLPFPDASANAIFHEHVLEHFPLAMGSALLRECYRVLRPNGILRVGVPDAGTLLEAYCRHDDAYLNELHPGSPTRILAVQELFYWHGHRTMYDEETLAFVFRAAGFPQPQIKQFGDSTLSPVPDTLARKPETLYMEATKAPAPEIP